MVGVHKKTQRQLACKIIDLCHLYAELPIPKIRAPNLDSGISEKDPRKLGNQWPSRVSKRFREFDMLKDLNHVR